MTFDNRKLHWNRCGGQEEVAALAIIQYNIATLPGDVMVACDPLEVVILVRIQARQ